MINFLNMREEKKRWVRVVDLPGDEALEAMMSNDFYSTVELPEYFVFLFSKNHAQVYAKAGMTGGSPEDFRTFIAAKTGRDVSQVK